MKEQIIDMAMNGSGIRDTARVLKISPTTVIEEKKDRDLEQVNQAVLAQLSSTEVDVVCYIEEAELDEMWSFVGSKKQQR